MEFKLRNYVKEGQKLPIFGIGPCLVYGTALLNIIVIVLTCYVFKLGIMNGIWIPVFRTIGAVLIVVGIIIWFIGAVRSGMDDNIIDNKLKTDGIYAWVRNPMYSGIWFFMVGVSLMWHNILLVPMILVD